MFSVFKNILYFYIFKKIVLTQRDDKQDIAYALELVTIRAEINIHRHMYSKMKWGDMY